jgi:hypothetical protein
VVMRDGGVDWKEGRWQRHRSGVSCDHGIVVAGDWGPVGDYGDFPPGGAEAMYGNVLPVIRASDLAIVNVEGPLSEQGKPIAKEGPALRRRPEAVAALECAPFQVACLANNHIMDYGPAALRDTQKLLRTHGIRSVGAGLSRSEALAPLVVPIGDARIGIVNFCEGEDATAATRGAGVFGWEIGTVTDAVRNLRPAADVLVVIAHAGREYVPAPPPYLQKAFRRIARAGADIVVGHHPHVPQGIEIFDGVPLVYSLGNFIFFREDKVVYRLLGYLLTLEIAGRRLAGFNLAPYVAETTGLRLLDGRERAWFLERLRHASSMLEEEKETREVWNAFIDSFGRRFWTRNLGGLAWPLTDMLKKPLKATAVLQNRFVTPAHRRFMIDGFSRLMSGRLGSAPSWAKALVREWMSLEGLPIGGDSYAAPNEG